jgi:hypothetical protein
MLSYFYNCVDEILLLDGYSTDRTPEILSLEENEGFSCLRKLEQKMRRSLVSNFYPEGVG